MRGAVFCLLTVLVVAVAQEEESVVDTIGPFVDDGAEELMEVVGEDESVEVDDSADELAATDDGTEVTDGARDDEVKVDDDAVGDEIEVDADEAADGNLEESMMAMHGTDSSAAEVDDSAGETLTNEDEISADDGEVLDDTDEEATMTIDEDAEMAVSEEPGEIGEVEIDGSGDLDKSVANRELFKRKHRNHGGKYVAPAHKKFSAVPMSKQPAVWQGKGHYGRWLGHKKGRRYRGKYPARAYSGKYPVMTYNKGHQAKHLPIHKKARTPIASKKAPAPAVYGKKGYGRWLGRKARKGYSRYGKYPRVYNKKTPIVTAKKVPVVTKKTPVVYKGKGAFSRWLGKYKKRLIPTFNKKVPVQTYNKKYVAPVYRKNKAWYGGKK